MKLKLWAHRGFADFPGDSVQIARLRLVLFWQKKLYSEDAEFGLAKLPLLGYPTTFLWLPSYYYSARVLRKLNLHNKYSVKYTTTFTSGVC